MNVLDTIETTAIDRRQLLPWWMKIFCWIFMLFGVAGLICLVLGLIGFDPELALYGLEESGPLSATSLAIIAIAVFKGLTALALWLKKDYAILLGKIDAVAGLAIYLFTMINKGIISDNVLTSRLELVLLIPYLIKLNNIQGAWKDAQKL